MQHAQEEEELSDEHDDQQENEPPSGYSQSAEQSDFANHNEDTGDFHMSFPSSLVSVFSEATPTAQYQEYNPYAEPRTPPQEENDDDLGDYVYNTTTQRSGKLHFLYPDVPIFSFLVLYLYFVEYFFNDLNRFFLSIHHPNNEMRFFCTDEPTSASSPHEEYNSAS